jgi:hypothetical protein
VVVTSKVGRQRRRGIAPLEREQPGVEARRAVEIAGDDVDVIE